MAWTGIADSGLEYSLALANGSPAPWNVGWEGSTIVGTDFTDLPLELLLVTDGAVVPVRITVESFSGPATWEYPAEWQHNGEVLMSTGLFGSPDMLPTEATLDYETGSSALYYRTASAADFLPTSFRFLIEVDLADEPDESAGCFWTDMVGVTEICAAGDPIELWGYQFGGSGGFGFDPDDPRNSELAGASSVAITGYYLPPLFEEPTAPTANLTAYDLVATPPLELTTGHTGPGTGYLWHAHDQTLPNGWMYARVEIDGVEHLCTLRNGVPF